MVFDLRRHPGKRCLIASPGACAVVGFSLCISESGTFTNTSAKLQISITHLTADLQIVWMVTCKRLVKPCTPASDIDWSKSIPEIDQQFYAKYGLDVEEVDFIEIHVKPMT